MALVPWLPHAFLGSLFINFLSANVLFERSTNGEWLNSSGTSSDVWSGSLNQVACNSKTRKTLRQKLTIIYWNTLEWQIIFIIFIEDYIRFIIQTAYSFLAVVEAQETEKNLVRVYEQRHNFCNTVTHPTVAALKDSVDLNPVSTLIHVRTFQNSLISISSKIKYINMRGDHSKLLRYMIMIITRVSNFRYIFVLFPSK